MKELLIKIDQESLDEIAQHINIMTAIDQFSGPAYALAYVVGAAIENGHNEIKIKDIKGLTKHLTKILNVSGG